MRRMYSLEQLKNIAKEVIESGLVDNAKPIYCHPLEIFKNGVGIMTALIFNNSSEKINSWTKLINTLKAFNSADGYNRLMVTGSWKLTIGGVDKTTIVSELVEYIEGVDTQHLDLNCIATDGTIITTGNNIASTTGVAVIDGVNKIN